MARLNVMLCRKCLSIFTDDGTCSCKPRATKGTRWAVWFPTTRKYISGTHGGLAWTRDRAEAEEMAGPDGEVVDADVFAKEWPKIVAATKGKEGG